MSLGKGKTLPQNIYGLELPDLPDDIHPVGCVILVKVLEVDSGNYTWVPMMTEDMNPFEALGILELETFSRKFSFVAHTHAIQGDEDVDE